MGPPVLCEKQISKTLSAKKAQKKVAKSRNVLAWPKRLDSNINHWPVLDWQTDDELKTLLGTLLPPAKLPSNSLPLGTVKKLKGEERKQQRLSLQDPVATDLRGRLLLGLNAVLRAVAKGDAAAVLVSHDAPRCLANLALRACRRGNVPAVVMPTLDVATRKALGFGCLAFGLRKVDQSAASVDQSGASSDQSGASSDQVQHFAPLQDRVAELVASLPCQPVAAVKNEELPISALEIPVKREPVEDTRPSVESVYKRRTSRLQRTFRPPRRDPDAERATADEAFDAGMKMEANAMVKEERNVGATSEMSVAVKKEVNVAVREEVKKEGNSGAISIVKAEGNAGAISIVKPEVNAGLKSIVTAEVNTGAKSEVKPGPGLVVVDVKGSLKRKADFLRQDFIPFGDSSVASQSKASVEPAAKRKAEDPEPTSVAAEIKKPRLPAYRSLVVKSIQPNPAKKKKGKKAKAKA